jgi:uncharacterized protein
MHSLIVPALDRTLGGLSAVLVKAEAHCAAKDIKPEALLNFRLFPDMLPFTKQVQLACDFAARGCARLAGADVPSFADTETSFTELQSRIKTARDYIASLPADDFEGAATRVISFSAGQRDMTLPGAAFFASFAMPQMHFHCTTAYNILRHNGVEVGKRDYMGG